MTIQIEHNLDKERGIICAEKIFSQLAEQYKDEFSDLKQETKENKIYFSFKIRGMKINGEIIVNENKVIIESKLPFAARIFQGMIETQIKENADKMLSECK